MHNIFLGLRSFKSARIGQLGHITHIDEHSLQGKRYMVTFIISHYKHRVSLQHSVTLSTDTIEGINW